MTNQPPDSQPPLDAHNHEQTPHEPYPPSYGYQGGYQQAPGYGPAAQFPANGAPLQKTSTKSGIIITSIGAFFAILTIVFVTLAINNAGSIAIADIDTAHSNSQDGTFFFAELQENTEYILLVRDSSSNTQEDEYNWVDSEAVSIDWRGLEATAIDGTPASITSPENDESSGLVEKAFTEIFKPSAILHTTTGGDYLVHTTAQLPQDAEITAISKDNTEKLYNAVMSMLRNILFAVITGFFAFALLVWGIILWSVRASRRKKQQNFTALPPNYGY